MRWLLTCGTDVDLQAASRDLALLGATIQDDPISLSGAQQALGVEGPANLDRRLQEARVEWIERINPDSEQTLL
jgi:hypothetical protein